VWLARLFWVNESRKTVFSVIWFMKAKLVRLSIVLLLLGYIGLTLYSIYGHLFQNTEMMVNWVKQNRGSLEAIRNMFKEHNQVIVWQISAQTALVLVIFLLLAQANRAYEQAKVVYVEKYVGREGDKSASEESGRAVALAGRAEGLQKILAASTQPEETLNAALWQCCQDLGAVCGAFFVVRQENGETFAELANGFALPVPSDGPPRFAPGEGITGQVLQDGREHLVAEVPADFLTVASGLGQALPGFIASMPVSDVGGVKGIIEIGTFRPLDAPELTYLRQFASLLGQYLPQHGS
jgi:GAF domain